VNIPPSSTDSLSLSRRRYLSTAGVGTGVGLAGCTSNGPPEADAEEGTVTVRLRNRDDRPRAYEVVVNQGESLRDSFEGVLPANQTEPIEMVATFRVTDEQYEFSIDADGGRRGRTWDPRECADFLVEASIADGTPEFDTACRER
jgi:hypothetical protein